MPAGPAMVANINIEPIVAVDDIEPIANSEPVADKAMADIAAAIEIVEPIADTAAAGKAASVEIVEPIAGTAASDQAEAAEADKAMADIKYIMAKVAKARADKTLADAMVRGGQKPKH